MNKNVIKHFIEGFYSVFKVSRVPSKKYIAPTEVTRHLLYVGNDIATAFKKYKRLIEKK